MPFGWDFWIFVIVVEIFCTQIKHSNFVSNRNFTDFLREMKAQWERQTLQLTEIKQRYLSNLPGYRWDKVRDSGHVTENWCCFTVYNELETIQAQIFPIS